MRALLAEGGLTENDLTRLATYNSERARGLLHSEEWHATMADLQQRYNRINFSPRPDIPERHPTPLKRRPRS